VITSGKLLPASVAAPAGVTIDVTLISADQTVHTATVAGHTLSVPARGRASVALLGLRRGTYPLIVDGSRAGSLVVGAQPGP
jgi:hypothetical protein